MRSPASSRLTSPCASRRRSSASLGYLSPIKDRGNLTIRLGARVAVSIELEAALRTADVRTDLDLTLPRVLDRLHVPR